MAPSHRLQPPVVSERGRTNIIFFSVLEALVVVTITLRLVAKRRNRTLGVDDWLIVLGFLFGLAQFVSAMCAKTHGYSGFHTSELYPDQVETYLKYVYINNIFYALTLPTIKLSLLTMYWKIFGHVRGFHYATIVVGIIVICWMISTLLVQIFTCNPVKGAWELAVEAKCIDQVKFYYGNSISNLITDVIILLLPMHLVWRLQMSTQRKIGLSGVILLGSFVCVSSILRIVTFASIDNEDITYSLETTAIWTDVEVPLAIVCACLPTLPSLLKILYIQASSYLSSTRNSLLGSKSKDGYQQQSPSSHESLGTEKVTGESENKEVPSQTSSSNAIVAQ